MDSITQIVLGAAVGEAVGGKKLGGKAALWGAIGGTIPDLDVLANGFFHPIDAALMHRGFSHSIIFAIIAAPIFGYLIHRIYKQKYDKLLWTKIMFLSILTHPLLDIFTNYGTSLFWPLNWRVAINSVFVLDPLYTIPFSIFLVAALFLKRNNKWRSRLNWFGIIYSSLYLVWGLVVKQVIQNSSKDYFETAQIDAESTRVSPMPLTSFYWGMLTEDDENYYIGYKSIFKDFDKSDIQTIPKNHELLDDLKWKNTDYSDKLKFFSNGYYTLNETHNSIEFYDLRFGTSYMFTEKKVTTPIMGFELFTTGDTIYRADRLTKGKSFDKVNMDYYWNKIF